MQKEAPLFYNRSTIASEGLRGWNNCLPEEEVMSWEAKATTVSFGDKRKERFEAFEIDLADPVYHTTVRLSARCSSQNQRYIRLCTQLVDPQRF